MTHQELMDIYRNTINPPIGEPVSEYRPMVNNIPTGEQIGYSDGMGDKFLDTSTDLPATEPIGLDTKNFNWAGAANVGATAISEGAQFYAKSRALKESIDSKNFTNVNDLKDAQKGATAQSALSGAKSGMAIGSSVGGVYGAVAGAVIGGVGGLIAGEAGQKGEVKELVSRLNKEGNKKFSDDSKDLINQYNYQNKADRIRAQEFLAQQQYKSYNV